MNLSAPFRWYHLLYYLGLILLVLPVLHVRAHAQNTATAVGILSDPAGQAWLSATWQANAVSPTGRVVYRDGSIVPPFSGQLDVTGAFSGTIGRTSQMQPAGATLTFILCSVTSAACQTVANVQTTGTSPINLGTILSARIVAPSIPAAPLVYAYNANEITNPTTGTGYINTATNTQFVFVGNSSQGQFVQIGFLPLKLITATSVDTTAANLTIGNGTGKVPGGRIFLGGSSQTNAVTVSPTNGGGASLSWAAPNQYANYTDLNTISAAGDWVGAAGANSPPQFSGQSFSMHVHTGNTTAYLASSLQTAWNSNPITASITPRFVMRINRYYYGWSPWVELLHDDGAGNVAVPGTLTSQGQLVCLANGTNCPAALLANPATKPAKGITPKKPQ